MRALPGNAASNGLVVSCCHRSNNRNKFAFDKTRNRSQQQTQENTTNPDACVEDTIIKKRFIEGQVIG